MSADAAALDREIRRLMAQRNEIDRVAKIPAGRIEARTTTELGKQVTRFYGDAAAAWAPFMPPVRNKITGFDR
ncbi:MAG: hypothetical protein B7Z58_01800 [Acidiphilium sp. 37-64-53]|uniref:hypothetical protein n=1 Tax=Acidiphilium TaxID=522 RepID=UPI000BC667AD|nr:MULTISPECIES: hypothetical protein [Acidiphilium]OYW03930.1 MAG: hypothetical protein B7Z58_01800 [Acidiphilium sp. 37-64-53]OZB21204.1 MAG: hypothetical protein B7X49_17980 [Acidiphilium sp. 34-64-41]HQT83863.1 hypothetical protein [Acidiphilium rubrum]